MVLLATFFISGGSRAFGQGFGFGGNPMGLSATVQSHNIFLLEPAIGENVNEAYAEVGFFLEVDDAYDQATCCVQWRGAIDLKKNATVLLDDNSDWVYVAIDDFEQLVVETKKATVASGDFLSSYATICYSNDANGVFSFFDLSGPLLGHLAPNKTVP